MKLKLRFRNLADLVAFRRKHVLPPCKRYFVDVERDGLEFFDQLQHGREVAEAARRREPPRHLLVPRVGLCLELLAGLVALLLFELLGLGCKLADALGLEAAQARHLELALVGVPFLRLGDARGAALLLLRCDNGELGGLLLRRRQRPPPGRRRSR